MARHPSVPSSQRVHPVTEKVVKHGERLGASDSVSLAALGMEAEFTVVLDGQQVKPEDLFGTPRNFIRGPLMHRVGRSYHLPTGAAIYFDTGVIEIATPTIELARGCAARAGRSLWESIRFLRTELDAWEELNGKTIHLAGFSAHYNVSFDIPHELRGTSRTVGRLAYLLTHILPAPVMLLAANRRSTGIGLRPRTNRVEVTADFTPDASLMIATATVVVAVIREVMRWPSFGTDQLERHGIPLIQPFVPGRHTSRKGWVARFDSFESNPFLADVDDPCWRLASGEQASLRTVARRIVERFASGIRRYGDPRSVRLIEAIMDGETPSLLELDDRPASYDSVGKLCTWADLFPVRALPRSRYERVFIRAIAREPLHLNGDDYRPVGMHGWSHVVFRRDRDKTRHRFSLDYLLNHLDAWELGSRAERRIRRNLRDRLERRG
jgi:hypothetical protein